jgi:DNA-binding response OmpR family regulator
MGAEDNSRSRNERVFTVAGREFKLSRTEYRLFEALRSRPGHAFSRAELVGLAMAGTIVLERTIDVHVKTLRQKFGQWAAMIQTVRGVGYKFVPLSENGIDAGPSVTRDGTDGVFTAGNSRQDH